MKIAFLHQPINSINFLNQDSSLEIWTYKVASRLSKYCDVIVYTRRDRPESMRALSRCRV